QTKRLAQLKLKDALVSYKSSKDRCYFIPYVLQVNPFQTSSNFIIPRTRESALFLIASSLDTKTSFCASYKVKRDPAANSILLMDVKEGGC
ncbi:MAG: hypothetical protein GXO64_00110, partial [Candidatus Micrarchaeota archaeon]|nr:hypothetical protein [Candidatus Micrarchaeota archaeon]